MARPAPLDPRAERRPHFSGIPDELRVNYARFWLSLIAKNSPKTLADRKRYAKLVGNVDEDMVSPRRVSSNAAPAHLLRQYPILESAITGRIGLAESDPNVADSIERKSSLLEMSESEWGRRACEVAGAAS